MENIKVERSEEEEFVADHCIKSYEATKLEKCELSLAIFLLVATVIAAA